MDKFAKEFGNSLIVNVEDDIKDYLEMGIDSFIENETLKEIPIVSSIVSGLKVAKNIYDRNLLKRTLEFIEELNNGTIERDKLIAYKSTIENNSKKCEEELGRVLIYLNNFIDKEKSVMLAKFFKSYIKEEITWSEFGEYAELINRLFVQDISLIKGLEIGTMLPADYHRIERLNSLGIIKIFSKPGLEESEILPRPTNYSGYNYIKLNDYGRKFVKIIK